MQNGKGSRQRPTDREKFAEGWERVFGKRDDIDEQITESFASACADIIAYLGAPTVIVRTDKKCEPQSTQR